MNKKYHIVFTTINFPIVVNDLYRNLYENGHLEDTKVWIIGDKKTVSKVNELAKKNTNRGLHTKYIDIEKQDRWGESFPEFYKHIPYNNETRRNIGYLMAIEDGCEILILIDDDNFPTNDDFIGKHAIVGSDYTGPLIKENNRFHNICEYLKFEPVRSIYPRGYPFKLRDKRNDYINLESKKKIKIGINAGLWLEDPDIDATTWLNGKIKSKSYTGQEYHVLDQSTWTPINTQNTSVIRELVPAFFCIPMGWDVPGGKIQRYGDIWGGYFLQAIIYGTKYHVSFGRPIVEHRRNPHDYLDDLRAEYWGMMLTDWMVNMLCENFKPTSNVITERIKELSNFIRKITENNLPKWCPKDVYEYLKWTADNLSIWSYTIEKIL